MSNNEETIRFPTTLNRKQIETRLVQVHAIAVQEGLEDVAERFAGVRAMSSAEIRAAVLGTLTVICEKSDHQRERYGTVAKALEMIALNLKNL